MADGEVRAQDLAQETASTLSGNEQFVMFDSTAGKRADIDDVATYVAGDKTTLKTTDKTSPVAAINENFDAIADVKEDLTPIADMNLYDKTALSKGIVNADGSITVANVYNVTTPIDVSEIDDLYYSGYSSDYGQGRIFFYGSNNTPIKGYLPGIGTVILHVPENAESVVFSIHNNDVNNVQIHKIGAVEDMKVDLNDTKDEVEFIQGNAIRIVYGNNLFDKNTAINGSYYNEDGLLRNNANLCRSLPIDVAEGETYSCYPSQFTVSFFDKNGGFIGCSSANQSTFTVPTGCVRCVYNLLVSQKDSAMFNAGTNVKPYESFTKSIEIIASSTYDIIVAKDGSGQYTSLTDAVANCSSGAVIFVKNGYYDNEEIDASAKTVYIIGQSREGVIITNDYNDYARPPLEASAGVFENLTFYERLGETQAQALAYACHIDYDYSYGKSLTFRNVAFKNDNYQALGIGLRGEFNLTFDNCNIYSKDRVAFYMHESVAASSKQNQNATLKDCVIHSSGSDQTIRLISYEQENASVNLEVINCALTNEATQAIYYFANIAGEGGTQTRVYTIADLVNYTLKKTSYGNQLAQLNYE